MNMKSMFIYFMVLQKLQPDACTNELFSIEKDFTKLSILMCINKLYLSELVLAYFLLDDWENLVSKCDYFHRVEYD